MRGSGSAAHRARAGLIVVVLAMGALAAGCGSGPSATAPATSGQTEATWAEPAGSQPNDIFPFMAYNIFNGDNTEQFQYLMYRPLLWFGQGTTPDLNPSLSIAQPPTYSSDRQSVLLQLKGYKWSDGETVTTRNVMFWMNMLHAQKANWAGYSPGALPDDVQGITVNSPTQLTMTLTGPVNPNWFTYNELSQITPMPSAWDISAAGGAPDSGGCATAAYGTADAACTAVYTYLSKQAGYDPANPNGTNTASSTYASNPLWQVVDGPFHLTKFDASGNVTMQPNPAYSGPTKATIKQFREVPFASESAEFAALVNGQIDVGYLPFTDVTQATANPLKAGPNNPQLAGNYTMDPLYSWAINYLPENFNSTGDGGAAGAIFKQLYFRQAVQLLVDQPRYIQKIDKGYGVGSYGPVPSTPANSFVSAEVGHNPYPYNPSKAVSLLKDHGWNVVTGGTSTCASPGTGAAQCGANVPAGAKLDFDLPYASGNDSLTRLMNAEKSSWASAGITVNLQQQPFSAIVAGTTPCIGSACTWEMGNWGTGWSFTPDFYPTGELLFQTGASANAGNYSDPVNDANIQATMASAAPLTQYGNYLAEQLPVIFQPNAVTQLTEVAKGLDGVLPQGPLQDIYPENWRFAG
jgi:peptide/nickel transport system substrate-binding protein